MVKAFIILLFSTCVYAQSVKVNQTDKDSLWYELKEFDPEINKTEYWINVTETHAIFYNQFAWELSELDPKILDKIRQRALKNK